MYTIIKKKVPQNKHYREVFHLNKELLERENNDRIKISFDIEGRFQISSILERPLFIFSLIMYNEGLYTRWRPPL